MFILWDRPALVILAHQAEFVFGCWLILWNRVIIIFVKFWMRLYPFYCGNWMSNTPVTQQSWNANNIFSNLHLESDPIICLRQLHCHFKIHESQIRQTDLIKLLTGINPLPHLLFRTCLLIFFVCNDHSEDRILKFPTNRIFSKQFLNELAHSTLEIRDSSDWINLVRTFFLLYKFTSLKMLDYRHFIGAKFLRSAISTPYGYEYYCCIVFCSEFKCNF